MLWRISLQPFRQMPRLLATQQPSRKTITGAIQTNLPGRVGLTMTSPTESRMLFGESGAENLLMKGDLLYKDIGPPKRYQAIYLADHKLTPTQTTRV